MKPKVLFVASIALHLKAFHLPYLKWFQDHGYETHVACSEMEDLPYVNVFWDVKFIRSPLSFGHFKAYKQLKVIIDRESFLLITTHTPMASILCRLASLKTRIRGTKLVYMAHGFHFFKGASFFNWLFYYPIEIFFSRITDSIICINSEDYNLIRTRGSQKCQYYLVPGIGVASKQFSKPELSEKEKLRLNLGIQQSKVVCIYSAEFIERKNHIFIIESLAQNTLINENLLILFAGKGPLEERLKSQVTKFGLGHHIQFIGFRKDIAEIYKLADVGLSSSKQEGLPINIVEEMLTGLPILCTNERGHSELIKHGINGYLFNPSDKNDFNIQLQKLISSSELRQEMGQNSEMIAQKFELSNALNEITNIYMMQINKV